MYGLSYLSLNDHCTIPTVYFIFFVFARCRGIGESWVPSSTKDRQEKFSQFKKRGFLDFSLFMYVIQHFIMCRPSDSTGSEDAGIETSARNYRPMPEFIDPVFTKTSPKRSFSLNRKRAFWLVFAKTGSIISGTSFRENKPKTLVLYD